jgi:hypothetical protein
MDSARRRVCLSHQVHSLAEAAEIRTENSTVPHPIAVLIFDLALE